MSDIDQISLDELLKEKTTEGNMSNYLQFLDESTNAVKRKNRQAMLLLILSYLAMWSSGIIAFWFFIDNTQGIGFSLWYFWIMLPVTTLILSIIIGKNDYWGKWKWAAAPVFGFLAMLAKYATFNAGNMITFNNLGRPAFELLLGGMLISALGAGIGAGIRKLGSRSPSLDTER
ncbi:hypothetical protein J2S70_001475 [Trueperella bonasi]|uniref:Uncharacterized protein n=1 Tax=Trueperella bonasi TaxID=312286 RepID=A0ABT9NIN7_9ACTO|nr:hypothetical protein [Trueperella bonasi]MDP9806893.1 hypothetical protein [Trueperella bonasi]